MDEVPLYTGRQFLMAEATLYTVAANMDQRLEFGHKSKGAGRSTT